MYGTVGRYKFKPGKAAEIQKQMEEMSPGGSSPDGAVAMFVFRMDRDPDEVFLVAVSKDKESYFDAANSPDVNAQYDYLSQFFAEEPQWNDGEVIMHDVKL